MVQMMIVTYPKIFFVEALNFDVPLADLVEVEEERVDIVQTPDALVECRHDADGVLGQFGARRLLISRLQFFELCEECQQICVLIKQSESKQAARERQTELERGECNNKKRLLLL